jgi:carbon-monoxide dehydrogenase small subunit
MSTELNRSIAFSQTSDSILVTLTVNNVTYEVLVDSRTLLVHLLRDLLALTGTNIGCLSGHCGACTILLDEQIVKSCTMLAVSADGTSITTVEGLAQEKLHPVQGVFWAEYGFQCGYCTPGMMMAATELLNENPHPTDEEIRQAITGNLCRCTGYQNIVKAIRALSRMKEASSGQSD